MARESTSLLTGEDARGRGRARVIFVAAVVAIVGTACVTLTLGSFPERRSARDTRGEG